MYDPNQVIFFQFGYDQSNQTIQNFALASSSHLHLGRNFYQVEDLKGRMSHVIQQWHQEQEDQTKVIEFEGVKQKLLKGKHQSDAKLNDSNESSGSEKPTKLVKLEDVDKYKSQVIRLNLELENCRRRIKELQANPLDLARLRPDNPAWYIEAKNIICDIFFSLYPLESSHVVQLVMEYIPQKSLNEVVREVIIEEIKIEPDFLKWKYDNIVRMANNLNKECGPSFIAFLLYQAVISQEYKLNFNRFMTLEKSWSKLTMRDKFMGWFPESVSNLFFNLISQLSKFSDSHPSFFK